LAIVSRGFVRKIQEKEIIWNVLQEVGLVCRSISEIVIDSEEGGITALCECADNSEEVDMKAGILCEKLKKLVRSVTINFPLSAEHRVFEVSVIEPNINDVHISIITNGCIQVKIANIFIQAAFCDPKEIVKIPQLSIPSTVELKSLSFFNQFMTFKFIKVIYLF